MSTNVQTLQAYNDKLDNMANDYSKKPDSDAEKIVKNDLADSLANIGKNSPESIDGYFVEHKDEKTVDEKNKNEMNRQQDVSEHYIQCLKNEKRRLEAELKQLQKDYANETADYEKNQLSDFGYTAFPVIGCIMGSLAGIGLSSFYDSTIAKICKIGGVGAIGTAAGLLLGFGTSKLLSSIYKKGSILCRDYQKWLPDLIKQKQQEIADIDKELEEEAI